MNQADDNSDGFELPNPFGIPEEQKLLWARQEAERLAADPVLEVDLAGFEGPLDLLLELSRQQKVDLAQISILALAEQYIDFIENLRKMRIELAADYLVMAAWLAYLKSKLLLPVEELDEEDVSGEELAAVLTFRLQRLEAMRNAGRALINRNRLGRDVFARGAPEPIDLETRTEYSATLYDLLSVYATQRQRKSVMHVTITKREVWSLQDARDILMRLIGDFGEWTDLTSFLLPYVSEPEMRNTVVASSFAASLELAREGKLKLRQDGAFEPIYLKTTTIGLEESSHGTTE